MHPYIPVEDRGQLHVVVDYLVCSIHVDRRAVKHHSLTIDTYTVPGTVCAIKEYVAIVSSGRHSCRMVGEDPGSAQLTQLVTALSQQSDIMAA